MALSVIQAPNNYAQPSDTTIVLTMSATASGSLIVVVGGEQGTTSSVTQISDNQGNIYTLFSEIQEQSGTQFGLATAGYCANATAGVTAITVHYSTATFERLVCAWEIGGAALASPDDGSLGLSQQISVNPTGPSVTTTNANDILLGFLGSENTISDGTGGGFISDGINNSSSLITFAYNHQIVSATGTYTPGWTESNTHYMAGTPAVVPGKILFKNENYA
jgi:hypothetical protein